VIGQRHHRASLARLDRAGLLAVHAEGGTAKVGYGARTLEIAAQAGVNVPTHTAA
jgi:hypothetical protein